MAAVVVRYCVRHPTRVLFIGLLLLLVIFSRFLYPSVPEKKQVDDLNLKTGFLSQQHGRQDMGVGQESRVYKNIADKLLKKQLPVPLLDRTDENSSKGKLKEGTDDDQNPRENKAKELSDEVNKDKELSEEVNKNNEREASNRMAQDLEAADEKAENEFRRHRKIPDDERSKENAGRRQSPFEMLAHVHEEDRHRNENAQEKHLLPLPKKSRDTLLLETDQNHHDEKKSDDEGKLTKEEKDGLTKDDNNVMMVLVKVGHTSAIAKRFKNCLLSVCQHASVNLTFHIVADKLGQIASTDGFNQARKVCSNILNVTYYDIDKVSEKVKPITEEFQNFFTSSKESYYNHPIFFMSTALHYVLPQEMHRIILLDADMLFSSDIKQLFAMFNSFKDTNIFGLAREQQPVYRHVFQMYRDSHPNTKIGEPPPDGLTGFNSGVVLVNLDNMRDSKTYKELLQKDSVSKMATKYKFQGHLGDQDFYSLLNVEHQELFYVLPCSWNRQLCTYWRDNGYADVFNSYYNCSEPVHIHHGNCKTKLPNE